MVPEGILPRREHEQRRANEIHQAVNRYMDAGLPIPKAWLEEYNELVVQATDQSVFSHPIHDIERPETIDRKKLLHLSSDPSGEALESSVCGEEGPITLDPAEAGCLICLDLAVAQGKIKNPI